MLSLGRKKFKSPGPNGVHMEAHLHGELRLSTHLSIFYTFCCRQQFLPQRSLDLTIVPMVKNKRGDLTDISNCSATAASNADTKILEKIFFILWTQLLKLTSIRLCLKLATQQHCVQMCLETDH